MISFEYVSFGYDGSRETLAGLNAAIRAGRMCPAVRCLRLWKDYGDQAHQRPIRPYPRRRPGGTGGGGRPGPRQDAHAPAGPKGGIGIPESQVPVFQSGHGQRAGLWAGERRMPAGRDPCPGGGDRGGPWAGEPLRAEHLLALWWTKAAAGLWLGLRHGPRTSLCWTSQPPIWIRRPSPAFTTRSPV